MKTKTKYICDICGMEFTKKEKCEEHEAGHVGKLTRYEKLLATGKLNRIKKVGGIKTMTLEKTAKLIKVYQRGGGVGVCRGFEGDDISRGCVNCKFRIGMCYEQAKNWLSEVVEREEVSE